jgi:hypothetical protein
MGWAGPLFEGHACSLGYGVADWIEAFCCHGEGDIQGEPAQVDAEMLAHIVECYRIDPVTGRRVYNEGVLSRPKGRAKSEIAAWVADAEAFGPVRFDGWDADGQPVGRPIVSPLIKCLATEEGQAGNTFKTIAFIAGEWGKDTHPEVYAGATGVRQYQSASAIYLPHGGEIRACTSGSASKDGGLESHVVADETHLYVLPELRNMYATVSRNLGKRFDADPWLHQTSTAYKPGEQSVFETTLTMWRKGELPESVYVNHRQAKGAVRLDDKPHTIAQLRYVYGVAAARIDLDRKYRDMRDPRICRDDAEAARYFLNRPESGRDAWIAKDVVERQEVTRLYADPHEWRSDIDDLAGEFGARITAWDTGRDKAMAAALDRLHTGLRNGEQWHSGDGVVLEHFGNGYVRMKGGHRLVRKEHPQSNRKIDSIVGAALAVEARADALAAGWTPTRPRRRMVVR